MRTLSLNPDPKDCENYLQRTYGLEPMTLDQEMELPSNAKLTRSNKISIITVCKLIRRTLDDIEYRARMAPVLDDQEHADLVDKFREAVDEAYKATERAWSIGQ